MAIEQQNAQEIINVSAPPPPLVRGRPVSFPDVLMRIVQDGPLYGVFLLIGFLVWKGHADTLQAILGAAVGLLANSNPAWREKFKGAAIMVFLVGGAFLGACSYS